LFMELFLGQQKHLVIKVIIHPLAKVGAAREEIRQKQVAQEVLKVQVVQEVLKVLNFASII